MKILYLCSKKAYDTKMSRIRFQSIAAIGNLCDLTYSGIGWDGYDNEKTVQDNIDYLYGVNHPDVVIAYKPLLLKNFSEITPLKVIRYNEMWDRKWTLKEIIRSGSQVVISHHLNDMNKYVTLDEVKHVKFFNISHCAEVSIYKDYGEKKVYDILFTGSVSSHYPFRRKLIHIVRTKLKHLVNCKVIHHPGQPDIPYEKIPGYTLEKYARELNKAKISLTCASKYKYRLGKYIEIPMCHSLLAADLPNEDHDFFKEFMLILDPSWSEDQIVNKLVRWVKNDDGREKLIQKGVEFNRQYTQEKYAERFIGAMEESLV